MNGNNISVSNQSCFNTSLFKPWRQTYKIKQISVMPQSHAAVFKVHDKILNEQRLLFSFAPKFCPFVSCILNRPADFIKVLNLKFCAKTSYYAAWYCRLYLLCLLFVIYYLIHFAIATSLFTYVANVSVLHAERK